MFVFGLTKRPAYYLVLKTSWNFRYCPAENECQNGHHDCDPQSQICIDTIEAYRCNCSNGYIESNEEGKCKPVCTKVNIN